MNIFRLVADMAHLASIIILLAKIWSKRSAQGISFKSQALYLVVFLTRYLDLFYKFYSIYNTAMKIFFIASAAGICYAMQFKFRATWDPALDTFRVEFLVGPAFVLALLINPEFTFTEILWSFSIYLEAVAVLPQLFQLTRTGEAETITTHYLFALGAYRALYLFNWIYRYFFDDPRYHVDWIAVIAGLVQTGLYCDFFYVYFTKVLKGKKFRLPA
ncbi:ER lumen protein retaining receptor-domain-containing protein [Zopfochytrium polystomum]|nr:ER lumen protein retaining receptor-domain-containing protein [Zopfochytrium polystomum]